MKNPKSRTEEITIRLAKYTLRTIDRLAELYGSDRATIVSQAVAYFDQIQKRGI